MVAQHGDAPADDRTAPPMYAQDRVLRFAARRMIRFEHGYTVPRTHFDATWSRRFGKRS